jgi:hypothetical protein
MGLVTNLTFLRRYRHSNRNYHRWYFTINGSYGPYPFVGARVAAVAGVSMEPPSIPFRSFRCYVALLPNSPLTRFGGSFFFAGNHRCEIQQPFDEQCLAPTHVLAP